MFAPHTHAVSLFQLVKWSALIIPPAIAVGSASAFFLWSLDQVTQLRWQHPWLLFLLPLGGLLVGLMYHGLGRSAEGGNNLIVEAIHRPGGGVPARMAPLVLIGTLVTHLFGGSAGREGTAVQMGGSLASLFGRTFRLGPDNLRVLLMSGVAAGFGSVFGTPLTGAVFAMEVLAVGRIQYEALIPVLIASVVGDLTCSAWGIKHAVYQLQFVGSHPDSLLHLDLLLLAKVVVGGAAFGLVSWCFSELAHAVQSAFRKAIAVAPLRPVIGGVLVIVATYALGTRDFLGIGVTAPEPGGVSILSAFHSGGAHSWSWLWKILFTVITLGSGFKGGEVTPLFFIGATLGNTLAGLCNAPVDLFAGLGFLAVFAGSTNTPLACTIMGIELFGAPNTVYFATACFIAYFFSGHSGIYLSQRVAVPKRNHDEIPDDIPLREVREITRQLAEFRSSPVAAIVPTLPPGAASSTDREDSMANHHEIAVTEMGKILVYLTPAETVRSEGLWSKLNPRRVYREIIEAARRDGLLSAVAYTGQRGFAKQGPVHPRESGAPEFSLPMCVELVDRKDKLEGFCRNHADLLQGRPIVYKSVEHWSVQSRGD